MDNIQRIDLEILTIAIKAGGTFNEVDLEKSTLKISVGRLLDTLASLKDRKMITHDAKNGTFSITKEARSILWNEDVPQWARVLRLLQIKSCKVVEMSDILGIELGILVHTVEYLRECQYVLLAPQIRDGKLVPMYEIQPEGIQKIQDKEQITITDNSIKIDYIISDIITTIQKSSMNIQEKKDFRTKVEELKNLITDTRSFGQ